MEHTTAVRIATIAAACVAAVALLAGPAGAGGATVTQGDFHAFATAAPGGPNAATYGGLAGRAQMVRTADGKTIVTVHLSGLLTNTTYPAHVHAAACGATDAAGAPTFADGHYKFDAAGPATPPNEIWPGFTTDSDGVGNGKATATATAGSNAVSVVVHQPGTLAKIGCADLS